jgi:hypothetical protein
MPEENTTAVVQRYFDALSGDTAGESLNRELMGRSVGHL